MAKRIYIPRIDSIQTLDLQALDLLLKEKGAKASIDCVNWPKDFPYRPDCNVTIAHDGTSLALLYHVRGLDLRAMETQDNGHMWEDSCVEFFVQDPDGSKYYNFELNCIGRLLAAEGASREGRQHRDASVLASIKRFSTVKETSFQKDGGIFSWTAGMIIPLSAFGAKGVKELKVNMYKCADKTAHVHFVSWSPIDLPNPDFHRPDFFGDLILL